MLAYLDDKRLNLNGVVILSNESGNVQVTLTEDELEEYQRETRSAINDDVISDEAINELVEWLDEEDLFEPSALEFHQSEVRRLEIVRLAQEQWREKADPSDLGFDGPDLVKVAEGDSNGAFVQAWVWVSFEGTPLDKEAKV